MTTLQEWLDNKYPTAEEKEQLEEIIIDDDNQQKELNGQTLNLVNCPNLERIDCFCNQLTNLDFLNNLNEEKLTKLYIHNNNITSDLTPFSKFINLEKLYLSDNNFFGSLQPLAEMVKLNRLNINYTNLDSGLEYLPESMEDFYCSADRRKEAKCKGIYNLLENTKGKNFSQKLQAYKQKIAKQKARELLKDEFQELESKVAKLTTIKETLDIYNSDESDNEKSSWKTNKRYPH